MTRVEKKSQVWVNSPIFSPIGQIQMAGRLRDHSAIPVERMRILGKRALVLVVSGEVFYADAKGARLALRPGDVIRVHPEEPHAYGGEGGTAWAQAFVIYEGPQFDLLDRAFAEGGEAPVWHLDSADFWLQRLEDLFLPAAPRSPLEALHTVGRFAQQLIEMSVMDATTRKHPEEIWLETSLHLLGEPRDGKWSNPREVARAVGLSYENFRKRFADRTGQPPARFQLQRRIDRACAEIYRGAVNFKQLAEELGFCDIYHFSKAFRQHVGEPPSSYRRRVRGG